MSRKCPFCKKEIGPDETNCPFCHRVLSEKIYKFNQAEYKDFRNTSFDRIKNNKSKQFLKISLKNIFNFIKKIRFTQENNYYVYQYDKWKKYKKIFFLIVGVFIIIIFFYFNGESKNQPTYHTNNKPAVVSPSGNINIKKEYNSLPNGTLLNSVPLYLKGLGQLKIENGINFDAVVKLVRSYPRKSIYTVYIKAKSTYKIIGISNGIYNLYFTHGKDWDKENQKFLISRSYSKFEDDFNFTTRDVTKYNGVYEKYSIYEITLHPVLGGSAKTDTISENEFSQF